MITLQNKRAFRSTLTRYEPSEIKPFVAFPPPPASPTASPPPSSMQQRFLFRCSSEDASCTICTLYLHTSFCHLNTSLRHGDLGGSVILRKDSRVSARFWITTKYSRRFVSVLPPPWNLNYIYTCSEQRITICNILFKFNDFLFFTSITH